MESIYKIFITSTFIAVFSILGFNVGERLPQYEIQQKMDKVIVRSCLEGERCVSWFENKLGYDYCDVKFEEKSVVGTSKLYNVTSTYQYCYKKIKIRK